MTMGRDRHRAGRPAVRSWAGGHAALLRLLGLTTVTLVMMSVLTRGQFLTAANFESMAFQFPELGLLSFAMMLAMLTGGIDLSIVSVANLSGVVGAMAMTHLLPADASAAVAVGVVLSGTLAALACGAICGAVNGVLVGRIGVSPILATLGTMQVFYGLAVVLTGGQAVVGLPDWLQQVGNSTVAGVPVPLWLFAVAAAVIGLLSNRTVFGLESRLVGSNPTASLFSGIAVPMVLVRTYLATALVASGTGVLMVAHANSAKADYGSSYLLQSILVVVLGGVHPSGGSGRVLGVAVAVLALQVLSSGFGMLHLSGFAKEFAWGGFLLLVMVANWYFEDAGR